MPDTDRQISCHHVFIYVSEDKDRVQPDQVHPHNNSTITGLTGNGMTGGFQLSGCPDPTIFTQEGIFHTTSGDCEGEQSNVVPLVSDNSMEVSRMHKSDTSKISSRAM